MAGFNWQGRELVGKTASLLLAAALTAQAGPALAADAAKVGTCLLSSCQSALAGCIGDAECLESLVCLQICTGRKDEAACQIRCGDLYKDAAVETFNACAVSQAKCVPQKVDAESYPLPPESALVPTFNLQDFQGRWYITAGQNPLFDTFDCQEHYFGVPSSDTLAAKINWRVPKADADFIERSDVQTFIQDPKLPAHLHNGNNAFLNYEDDWFIIASKPQYHFIYYQGNNDAWKGYGGAVVYTRERSLPTELIPELSQAAEKVGLKWTDFKLTDNTCGPHPPLKGLVERARGAVVGAEEAVSGYLGKEEKELEKEVTAMRYTLSDDLRSFGRNFTVIERNFLNELRTEERGLEKVLTAEEQLIERDLRLFLDAVEKQYETAKEQGPWQRFFQSLRMPQLLTG